MKIFQFLLVLVFAMLSSTNALRSKQQQERKLKDISHEIPEGFIRELKQLSARPMPKLDTRRKLQQLIDKYDVNTILSKAVADNENQNHRNLVFWDMLGIDEETGAGLTDIFTQLVTLLGPVVAGGLGRDNKNGNGFGLNLGLGRDNNNADAGDRADNGESAPLAAAAKVKGKGKRGLREEDHL